MLHRQQSNLKERVTPDSGEEEVVKRVAHDNAKIASAAFESMPEVIIGCCRGNSNGNRRKNNSVTRNLGAS